jgi:hypothetical protein
MWNPFFAQASNGNAQAHECFATIASEWQEFVGRRLNEDVALMQRLAQSVTPDQVNPNGRGCAAWDALGKRKRVSKARTGVGRADSAPGDFVIR